MFKLKALAVILGTVGSLMAPAVASADRNCPGPVVAQDREEIQELITSYGVFRDYRQGAAWASTFTDDGELSFPLDANPTGARKVVKGKADLTAYGATGSTTDVFAHAPLSTIMVKTGPSTIKAFTPVGTVQTKTNQLLAATFNGFGAYTDDIVKTPKGWRFQKRYATTYAAGQLPAEIMPCTK